MNNLRNIDSKELEQRISKGIDQNLDPKFYNKNDIISFRVSTELKQDITEYLRRHNLTLRIFALELIKDRITTKEYAE